MAAQSEMKNCRTKKIVLNKNKEYFNVHIFKCTGMLHKFLNSQKWFFEKMGKADNDKGRVLATTHVLNFGKKLADIYFSQEDISIGTIAHESFHLASGFMEMKGKKIINLSELNDEEQYAKYTGDMTQRVADYIYSII